MLRKLVDTIDGLGIPRPTTENAKVPSCAIGPNHEEGGPRFEVEVTWGKTAKRFSDDVRQKWLGDIC